METGRFARGVGLPCAAGKLVAEDTRTCIYSLSAQRSSAPVPVPSPPPAPPAKQVGSSCLLPPNQRLLHKQLHVLQGRRPKSLRVAPHRLCRAKHPPAVSRGRRQPRSRHRRGPMRMSYTAPTQPSGTAHEIFTQRSLQQLFVHRPLPARGRALLSRLRPPCACRAALYPPANTIVQPVHLLYNT
jgi:hypothetical protein